MRHCRNWRNRTLPGSSRWSALLFFKVQLTMRRAQKRSLGYLLARVRYEGNGLPEYVKQAEQQYKRAVELHAQANQRLHQIMKDSGDRS